MHHKNSRNANPRTIDASFGFAKPFGRETRRGAWVAARGSVRTRLWSVAFALLVATIAAGCTCSPNATRRSGTLDEPYVEEPLTEVVLDKASILETSNTVVSAIASGDRDAAYAYMHPKGVERDKFDTMLDFIQSAHGSILDFRPMQWWFIEDGTQVLSVKLLVFEHGCGAVRMMFLPEDPTQVFRLWIGGNSCSPNAEEARRQVETAEGGASE